MKLSVSFFFILLLIPFSSFSQEYSYTHYDTPDGLAGSTVYCITQDKDGFIWVGTETGVSRFDGTHFHNYTTVDGLPDVEVLEMFGDSKGRVWMAPFRKSICYYFKGKIYNQGNDSLLRDIRINGNIEHFAEDATGNILVQEPGILHLIRNDGRIVEYDSIAGQPILHSVAISRSSDGHFFVQAEQQLYTLSDKGFTPFCPVPMDAPIPGFIAINPAGMIWRTDFGHSAIRSFISGKTVALPFEQIHYRHISFSAIDDSLFYFNEFSGTTEYNLHSGHTKHFLSGKQVSRTFRDATGNTWFTTLGNGIYRLNSDEFQTFRLHDPGMEASSIYVIKKIGDHLIAGDNHNAVFEFSLPDKRFLFSGTCVVSKNRIFHITTLPSGDYLFASDQGLYRCTRDIRLKGYLTTGLKSVFEKNANELLLSGFWGVGLFDLSKMRITDTLWHDRATTVYFHKDTTYIGTLNGLYAIGPTRTTIYLGQKIPFLQRRISDLAESADGTLWVASYDAGVVGYKNGKEIVRIGKQQGLTSDICRTIMVHDNNLWIGTDKGLNRVRLDQPNYPVAQYTSKDGLGSDIVNSVYADGPVIYVGTPAGLSFFDEAKVDLSEGIRLYLLSVLNAGKERISDTAAGLIVPFTDKYIRLEFAAISYRSVGGITYRYRIPGLDKTWRTTMETFIEYPTLPSGTYEFQLQASNKFGVSSPTISLHFVVQTPFWQTAWFYGLGILLFLLLTWLFVSLRIDHLRGRQREKERLNQRMMELEHAALQAQMNPHFIFNCLNSIQQYIFTKDVFDVNKYISGFSKLIRATLQNSSKPFIPLADEIGYLSGYLSLEKLRFKEKMDYHIDVEPAITDSDLVIPPMLIQPYVENSIRHGLRHKTEGKGFIRVQFRAAGKHLSVIVEDNGIGRKKAGSFKTSEHIEYQSKGMSLTADRIRIMNTKYSENIRVDIIDLEDEAGQSMGTRVVMQFPLNYIVLQNSEL